MMLKMTGFFWILLAGAIYGLIHSSLASNWCKNLSVRWFGEGSKRYYRLFFVLAASLTTLGYLALVILLPDELIYLILAPWVYLTLAVQAAAVIGVFICLSQISTSSFLGLTALPWFRHPQSADQHPALVTSKLYHWVRHPIYTCSFIFLLAMPWLSWNTLAFTIGVIVYTVIGAVFEERKMVQEFGAVYLDYQKKTPMFVPIRLK